jgi:hypothetical protein
MTSSDEYRRMAQECVELAERASDANDRVRLLAMAQAWRDMADKKEAKTPR